MLLPGLLAVVALLGALVVKTAGWRFALRRVGALVITVVLVTFGTTVMLRQVPGDPCVTALGTSATDESVALCRDERRLDEHIVSQYGAWAGDLLTGDLGYASYKSRLPLTDVLGTRAPRTGLLFLYSQIVALAVAVPLGVMAAYQAGRRARRLPRGLLPVAIGTLVGVGVAAGWSQVAVLILAVLVPTWLFFAARGGRGADTTVNATAFVLLSIPVFVLGEVLRYVFAIHYDLYDLVGYRPLSAGIGAHLRSVWLPAVVLGLAVSPVYLRLLRADMIQNLQQDFVAVARAKGMPDRHILLRHVLRPSTVTLLTVAGLNVAQLVNGAIVVEYIYDLDGMGSFLIESVSAREFFPIQTLVAVVAVLFVVTNTLVDALYTVVDPRVRAEDDR